MSEEDRMLWMFKEVHGEPGNCYLELYHYEGELIGVKVMKDGNLCWSVNKADLMFDYLTKHLGID